MCWHAECWCVVGVMSWCCCVLMFVLVSMHVLLCVEYDLLCLMQLLMCWSRCSQATHNFWRRTDVEITSQHKPTHTQQINIRPTHQCISTSTQQDTVTSSTPSANTSQSPTRQQRVKRWTWTRVHGINILTQTSPTKTRQQRTRAAINTIMVKPCIKKE